MRALPVLLHSRILHLKMPQPLFGLLILLRERTVFVKESGEGIAVHPDLIVSLLLGLVKNKLQPPVKMDGLDVVGILFGAVAGVAHVADYIPGGDHAALLQLQSVGKVLPQMGVIVVTLSVKAADSDAPAAVLVPAQGLHVAGLNTYDGSANLYKK